MTAQSVQAEITALLARVEQVRADLNAKVIGQNPLIDDLLTHPNVPHVDMGLRWGVAESTVRWHRVMLADQGPGDGEAGGQ